jgi:hypothetical protein
MTIKQVHRFPCEGAMACGITQCDCYCHASLDFKGLPRPGYKTFSLICHTCLTVVDRAINLQR